MPSDPPNLRLPFNQRQISIQAVQLTYFSAIQNSTPPSNISGHGPAITFIMTCQLKSMYSVCEVEYCDRETCTLIYSLKYGIMPIVIYK